MQVLNALIFVMIAMLIAGCAGQRIQEGIYRGVYEGSHIYNMRGTTPAENIGKPDISYEQYNQQRKEQFQGDSR